MRHGIASSRSASGSAISISKKMITVLFFVVLCGAGILISKFPETASKWAGLFVFGPLFFLCFLGGLYGMFLMFTGGLSFSIENLLGFLVAAFFVFMLLPVCFGGFEWFEKLAGKREIESAGREDIGRSARHDDSVGEVSSVGVKGPSVYVKCPYCTVTLSFNESWIRSQKSVICKNCGNNSTVVLVGSLGIKLRSPQG